MYAVIKTGGKQYKVAKDDVIAVEKLDAENGASVELTEVLLVGNGKDHTTGTPLVDGATVAAEVVTQTRGKKILVFKKKRRKDYRRTRGHRQLVTMLRITDILTDGKKPAKKAAAPAPQVAAAAAPKAETKPAPETKTEPKPAPETKSEPKPAPEAKAEAKPAAKPAAKPKAKPAAKKPADKTETKAKPATKKPAAKKPAAKKPAAKKPAAKKPAAKKPAAKKPAAKKPAAKKPKE